MSFPTQRPRRLRTTPAMRRLVAEVEVSLNDLVAPLFVREGITDPQPILSLPGQFQHTVESLCKQARELANLGVPAIMLFGVPEKKDAVGSEGWNPDGIAQRALRAVRDEVGDDLVVMSDLCLDEYTDHGHCGVLLPDGDVDNDATLELYAKCAIAQAQAGAHVVAPSGMMDGQVGAIRSALDATGFINTAILAYSAKFASAEYGPFRDAVGVQIQNGGNRKTYQQDGANVREAMREVALDIDEGADMVMVKPALAYLDVLSAVASESSVPVAAYHVSGEYAMVKAASENGWVDGSLLMREHLTSIKRAGADIILTYAARDFAESL